MRAALGKAAFDTEQGLTLLNFLRQFPTKTEMRS
ncbi:MAG: alpha/beta hydrolase [Prochloraceae cyanobacterium]